MSRIADMQGLLRGLEKLTLQYSRDQNEYLDTLSGLYSRIPLDQWILVRNQNPNQGSPERLNIN
jgi:hypothetical protein